MTMVTPGVQRSMSTANGIYSPKEDVTHPKYASAPDTVDSPLSLVPEVRLTQPSIDGEYGVSSVPLPKQEGHEKAMSEGRSSPEPQLPQFGGLMVTNPDANASEAESMASPRPRRVTLASSSPLSSEMVPPKMPFLAAGMDSADSSPATQITPLRVINGQDPETETEAGTILASPVTIRESLASPQESRLSLHSESRRSLHSESDVRLLGSAIPSIPDLPNISPFNPAQMLTKSPSPRITNIEPSLHSKTSIISSSTGSTPNQYTIQFEEPSTPKESAKPMEAAQSRPRSTYSVATNKSTVDTIDLASSVGHGSDDFTRPTPRKNSVSQVSRYAAYYSPDTYPAMTLPPAPQPELNPLPTPPARFPLPLQESNSREKLQELKQQKDRAKIPEGRQNTDNTSRPYTEPVVEPRKSRDMKQDKAKPAQEPTRAKEKRSNSTFRMTGDADNRFAVKEKSSAEHSSRAPVEVAYNVTNSRPTPLHKRTIPSSSSQRPSDEETSSDRQQRFSSTSTLPFIFSPNLKY